MKIQQQQDGTWLATQELGGKLHIAEADSQNDAWYAMMQMMGHHFDEQVNELAEQSGHDPFHNIRVAERTPIIQTKSL